MKIEDYWCNKCGLIGNFEFACPQCGSIDYGVADFDLAPMEPEIAAELMTAYEDGRLHAERADGRVYFHKRPIQITEEV
ncbi:hypothetical protein LCGC14_1606170 [marine sediment metagenome]|uniref:Uncharacterized protein n=1 Tax=marine sediment metagenome TaxID=412755 RepID=A0A0F9L9M0_9ZZZZ|nr:hypothetical protein [Methylophaga sp.]